MIHDIMPKSILTLVSKAGEKRKYEEFQEVGGMNSY